MNEIFNQIKIYCTLTYSRIKNFLEKCEWTCYVSHKCFSQLMQALFLDFDISLLSLFSMCASQIAFLSGKYFLYVFTLNFV